ncbi:MAG: hypothetical protein J6J78_01850 [Clostridia bacterium]|nr:hypothetical protein [Clostridia bacterium]
MQNVYLSDITMKLADSSAGFSLSFREKIELAKLLDRLNVSVIELSPIKNRKIDSLLIKSIATAVKHGAVAVPVSQDPESIEITWAALKDAKKPRLQLKAPMSPAQMEYFWHKKPDKLLEAIRDLITRCRALCADVEFIADDACRAERSFLYQAVKTAIEAGATAVTLCDAAGLMFPEEFAAFVNDVKAAVPQIESIRLGVLCSNALSMAGACAMAAVRAGVQEVKVASYAGEEITHLSEFAAILRGRGDELGICCDLRHAEIKRITSQIERVCAAARNQNAPFGSAQDKSETSNMVLSEHDDRAAVLAAVEKLGYDLSEEDAAKVYDAFKSIAAKKGTVGAHELDTIVASAALQVPPTYRLSHYVINCGNIISASAHMKLTKGEEILEGIGLGDGPIDAAFTTIEQILGRHYELDDFQIQSVTEGREAMGETIVRLRSNGKLYSGRGISTDIVGASIQAYLSALNKIVYEEAEA